MRLVYSIEANDIEESKEHYWPVCAVFYTSVHATEPDSACVSLSQLLRAEKIRCVDGVHF